MLTQKLHTQEPFHIRNSTTTSITMTRPNRRISSHTRPIHTLRLQQPHHQLITMRLTRRLTRTITARPNLSLLNTLHNRHRHPLQNRSNIRRHRTRATISIRGQTPPRPPRRINTILNRRRTLRIQVSTTLIHLITLTSHRRKRIIITRRSNQSHIRQTSRPRHLRQLPTTISRITTRPRTISHQIRNRLIRRTHRQIMTTLSIPSHMNNRIIQHIDTTYTKSAT